MSCTVLSVIYQFSFVPSQTDIRNTGADPRPQRSGTHKFFDMRSDPPLISWASFGSDSLLQAQDKVFNPYKYSSS